MTNAPDARLLYATSVDTPLGTRDVSIYWGSIADLLFEPDHTMAVVSTTVYHAQPAGQAWKALCTRTPALLDAPTEVVLTCDPAGIWKPRGIEATWDALAEKAKAWPPAILVTSPPTLADAHDPSPPPRRVMIVRTVPHASDKADLADYLAATSMVYPAFRAVEACEATQGGTFVPYRRIVMSALAARQGFPLAEALLALVREAKTWLTASPLLRRVDIAYIEATPRREDPEAWRDARVQAIRTDLVAHLPERQEAEATPILDETLKRLQPALQQLLVEANASHTRRRGPRKAAQALNDPLQSLVSMIQAHTDGRGLLVAEFCVAAGRLTEALVVSMSADLGLAESPTFEKGIERLGQAGHETNRSLSRWFKSYLHTLRVLRNESAHASEVDRVDRQLPRHLSPQDLEVLAISLRRVVSMHGEWRDEYWR